MKRADADPPQDEHFFADRFEHPADFAILPFAQHHHEPRCSPGRLFAETGRRRYRGLHTRGAQPFAFVFHSPHQPLQVPLARHRIQPNEVLLIDFVPGMGQQVGEVAVVREQHETFAVAVQPAHGVQLDVANGDEVEDRLAVHFVVGGRDEAGRLVEHEVAIALAEDGHAIHDDLVGIRVRARSKRCLDVAIDRYAAREDEFLGDAAGRHARVRKDLLKAFIGHGGSFEQTSRFCAAGCRRLCHRFRRSTASRVLPTRL